MNHHLPASLVLTVCLALPAARAADAPSLCATPEQAKAVTELYAQSPAPPPFMAAAKLGVPETIVLSALPAEKAVGTTGAGFLPIWESLRNWDESLTLVLKAGQVFEIYGRIPGGEPSKVSQNYNLKQDGPGLGGHLRPDLIGAIYAVTMQGREGPMRGVTFLDALGNSAFHVFLPEGRKPTEKQIAQFESTRALIAGMPRACTAR